MSELHKFANIVDLCKREKLYCDVYILINERLLLIGKAGSPSVHLEKFLKKGVEKVVIREPNYAELIRSAISDATTDSSGGTGGRITRLNSAMTLVFLQIETMSFDEQIFFHAKQVNSLTLNFLKKNPRLTEIVANVGNFENDLVKHSMMVSMLSVMLGISQGWTMPSTLEKLALAGFLHDVGKTRLPRELISKPVSLLTPAEKVVYDRHGELGSQLLATVKSVPDDVRLAVGEHHEFSDGSGYKGISDAYISPMARAVSLANFIVGELEARPGPHTIAKLGNISFDVTSLNRRFNRDVVAAMLKIMPANPRREAA